MVHAGGAPTKYKPEYCKQAIDYFQQQKDAGRRPTLAGFAFYLDVDKDTIQEWKKKHKEFSVSIKKSLCLQEDVLVNGDKIMDIFCLKNNHGYTDKQEIEHSGNVELGIQKLQEMLGTNDTNSKPEAN